jgi:hypothetical protein
MVCFIVLLFDSLLGRNKRLQSKFKINIKNNNNNIINEYLYSAISVSSMALYMNKKYIFK